MSKFKVAVLISGGGSNLQAIIDKFQSDETIELSCVLSNKKEAYGLKRASKANIDNFFVDHTIYSSREDFDRELIRTLEKYKPDLVVLAGFMRILSPLFVNKSNEEDVLGALNQSLFAKTIGKVQEKEPNESQILYV